MGITLLKAVVSGNGGISLVLLLLVGTPLWRCPSLLARPWRDADPRWRLVGRSVLVLQVMLWFWVTFFDYWRQLLGLLMTEQTRYYSDPYTIAPVFAHHEVSLAARAIAVALLCAGALGLAVLFARYVGGPLLPLGMLVIGLLLYLIFGDARWRMNVWAANGFPQVGQATTGDLLVDSVFFSLVVVFDALLVLLHYLTLAALFALPIVVIERFLAERSIRPTPEYRAFTSALSAHAATSRTARDDAAHRLATETGGPEPGERNQR